MTELDTTGRDLNKRLMGNIVREPVVVRYGEGSNILTENGTLLDFWGDEGVASLGYGDEFNYFMKKFVSSGAPHRLPDVYPNQIRWACAEAICSKTEMDRIFFACTGTEANEAAIKLARKYWWDKAGKPPAKTNAAHRHRIFTIEGNFHGRTGFASAASDSRGSPYHKEGFGPFAHGFGVLSENLEVVHFDGSDYPYYEPAWDTVAAVILAPILGNNVVKTYPREFWDRLQEAREKHGFLLIYDDVQAGNGRSGAYATWQLDSIRVKPDIMTLSKGMAMGLPLSAMLAREEVAASFTPGVHFNTFGGTIVCCAAALHYYQWLENNLEDVRAKGEKIRSWFAGQYWIKHHDGSGMMNAFTPDYDEFGYNGLDFCRAARRYGLSLVTHRDKGMIRFTPPMNVTLEELNKAFGALVSAHKELTALVSTQRDVAAK